MSVIVKHHLGLGDQVTCIVAGQRRWIRGNFNVCVPIEVESPDSVQELILRCAMPHKLAEAHNPGSVDEKLGCEVGAYAWIQERCPEIRIPHLYGFGFLDRRHVRLLLLFPLLLITNRETYNSLPTKLIAPHTYALFIVCGACSTLSLDIQPFSRATLRTQLVTTYPQHTCYSKTLGRTIARCSRTAGRNTEGIPPTDIPSSEAWLESCFLLLVFPSQKLGHFNSVAMGLSR